MLYNQEFEAFKIDRTVDFIQRIYQLETRNGTAFDLSASGSLMLARLQNGLSVFCSLRLPPYRTLPLCNISALSCAGVSNGRARGSGKATLQGLSKHSFCSRPVLFPNGLALGYPVSVVDGLKGFPEAITAIFPQTQVQTCIVHLIRNSLEYCGWQERKAFAAALKGVYTAGQRG